MKTRTTWRAKLEKDQRRESKDTPKGRMLIPRPLDVDAVIRQVGEGKLMIVSQIREKLAKQFGADYTCPMCTGMFLRIAAEAAAEDLASGKLPVTPYWRAIKDDGSLIEKFPGGVSAQAVRLEKEGHTIMPPKGKGLPWVKDFEKKLQGTAVRSYSTLLIGRVRNRVSVLTP